MSDRPRAFFLFGDGGLTVEPDITQAAAYMEPIDVTNGEYDAVFDDTGRRYRVGVAGGTTHLEPSDEVDLEALQDLLRDVPPATRSLEGFDPDCPLAAAEAISRYEWANRWPKRPRWLSRRLHGGQPPITR